LVATVAAVWRWTRSDRATFAMAVVAAAFATPAFYFQAIALLLAAVAPWALQVEPGERRLGTTDQG
jgi:chromate transport protein ChrA